MQRLTSTQSYSQLRIHSLGVNANAYDNAYTYYATIHINHMYDYSDANLNFQPHICVQHLNLLVHGLLRNHRKSLWTASACFGTVAALVGSLCIGITFLLSTVSGILTDRIGLRNTTFIGGILAASGMFLSAVFVHNIVALYFTFGVMFGLGAALAYTPSLSILGHYFKRYLGLANGFVTAGSSVSTALLPQFLEYSIREYSLQYTFCVLGFFSLFIVACSLIYKPLRPPERLQSFTMPPPPATGDGDADADADNVKSTSAPKLSARCAFVMRSLVNVDNWRRPRYVIWAVSIPVALIGYFVPYVHTPKLVQVSFAGRNVSTPIVCIGIASGVGRMVCGFLADRRCVNRIYLQQISFVAIGLLTMLIPLTSSYLELIPNVNRN